MNLRPHFIDVDAVRHEFPDARQISTPERDRLLSFWAEVGAVAERHGYGSRLSMVTALIQLTAVLVAGDRDVPKTKRQKLARQTITHLRNATNLVLKHGIFVNPETRGSA